MEQKDISMSLNRQKKDFYCGPSCMQAIGMHNGKYRSQDFLFGIARDVESSFRSIEKPTGYKGHEEGIGHTGMIVMASSMGLDGFVKNKAHFSDIRYFIDKNIPVLIDCQLAEHSLEGMNGHYSLIKGYEIINHNGRKIPYVKILDPLPHPDFSEYKVNFYDMQELWYDFSGKREFDRWIAAFFPKGSIDKMPSKGFVIRN